MIYKMTPRLEQAFDLLPEDAKCVIDIGADHGILSLQIKKKGIPVYAVENKPGPYNNIVKMIEETKSQDLIKPILDDGIRTLPKEVDTAFLLGMGGKTIYGILATNPKKLEQLKTIIIEPQSDFYLPINFLLDNGYVNDKGVYVFEKHLYPVLRFVKGEKKEYTKAQRTYGPYPLEVKDPCLKKCLDRQMALYAKLAEKGILSDNVQVTKEALKQWN